MAEAYGWPADLSEDDILHRLVALNHARAAEEAAGHIRWLRPDYQNPAGRIAAAKTGKLDLGDTAEPADKPTWPKSMPDQMAAVRDALSDLGQATPEQVARSFKRGRATSVLPLLESMTALGLAARSGEGVYRPTR